MRSPTYLLNAETLYKTNHTGILYHYDEEKLFYRIDYLIQYQGFLANGVVGAMAFNRLPYTAPHYTPGNDVSAGPKTPNIELALGVSLSCFLCYVVTKAAPHFCIGWFPSSSRGSRHYS